MREIKFRAWDTSLLKMEYYSSLKDICKAWEWRIEDGKEVWDDGDMYIDDLEIMQYTRLKDKNGVEIYEGDIISIFKLRENMLTIGTMPKMLEVYTLILPQSFVNAVWVRSKDWDYSMDILLGYDFEVIGNIYENSELLQHNNSKT